MVCLVISGLQLGRKGSTGTTSASSASSQEGEYEAEKQEQNQNQNQNQKTDKVFHSLLSIINTIT